MNWEYASHIERQYTYYGLKDVYRICKVDFENVYSFLIPNEKKLRKHSIRSALKIGFTLTVSLIAKLFPLISRLLKISVNWNKQCDSAGCHFLMMAPVFPHLVPVKLRDGGVLWE